MPKEVKNKLLTRFLLGMASDNEKEKIFKLPESEQIMKTHWESRVTEKLPDTAKKEMLESILRRTSIRTRILAVNPVLLAAAAILVGLVIGSIVFYEQIFPDAPADIISYQSPAGQRTKYALPDGSEVLLAGSSQIDLSVSFDDIQREVWLTGEAFFNVARNEDAPFIVKTSDITVSVLGTCFSVTSYPGDLETQTILLSGKVRVECITKDKAVDLYPGEKHAYNRISKAGEITKVDADRLLSWVDGKLIFDQADIYTVSKRLERWFGVQIEVNNPGKNNDLYTFTIENNTLDEVLLLMKKISPMTYVKNEEGIEIIFKEQP
jgi:ferric-dicitrate binding protein FerR (iron transport regulator)